MPSKSSMESSFLDFFSSILSPAIILRSSIIFFFASSAESSPLSTASRMRLAIPRIFSSVMAFLEAPSPSLSPAISFLIAIIFLFASFSESSPLSTASRRRFSMPSKSSLVFDDSLSFFQLLSAPTNLRSRFSLCAASSREISPF